MALKIFEASRRLAAISAQFAAAGLDLEQFISAADETALKAHLDSLKGDAALADKLASANETVAALTRRNLAFVQAHEAAGVKLTAADAANPTADEIAASIKARASIMASEQLGKHGLAAPLPVAPSADSTKPAAAPAPALTGLARVTAAFKAQREAAAV